MAWLSLGLVLMTAGQSLGVFSLIPTVAHCTFAGWHPEAAALAALCSLGAMALGSVSGVLVNTGARLNVATRALRVPIAIVILLGLFAALPVTVWAAAWLSSDVFGPDAIRGYALATLILLPQVAATMSLLTAYAWSHSAKSISLAALWPLIAWTGCVLTYAAVTAAVQVPHCAALL